jgi:hypothetical protein
MQTITPEVSKQRAERRCASMPIGFDPSGGRARVAAWPSAGRGTRAVLRASPMGGLKQLLKAGLGRSSVKPNGSRLLSSTAAHDP